MVSNQVVRVYPVIYCCIYNQPKLSLCVLGAHWSGSLEGLAGLWSPGRAGHRGHHGCKCLCIASQLYNLRGIRLLMGVLQELV